jgi:hypothetical protein
LLTGREEGRLDWLDLDGDLKAFVGILSTDFVAPLPFLVRGQGFNFFRWALYPFCKRSATE